MKTTTKIPERPTKQTTDLTPAIKALAKQIHEWCSDDTSLEMITCDVQSVLKQAWDYDGYELAKFFDRKGYTADRELVEILDQTWHLIRSCVRNHIKEWVQKYNIQPQLQVGQSVTLPAELLREEKEMEGTVHEINQETGEYTINIPELGHVQKGELGTQGRVYKFEQLHKL